MKRVAHVLIGLIALTAVLAVGVTLFVYSGIYDIGADAPHTRPVFALMETLRDRSVRVRAKHIEVPDLDDPARILEGAGHYAAMCTGCHLAPGKANSEIRPGLYPRPPNLTRERVDPREAFWVIKHGIKMSAMPAWGLSHDDDTIWSMVAFLRKLPDLAPASYRDIVASAPADDDSGEAHPAAAGADAAAHGHDHGHEQAAVPGTADAFAGLHPGAVPDAEAVAEALHAALGRGDRERVLGLLAADARVSEAGRSESREEYAAAHLGADIAFLAHAQIRWSVAGSMRSGDAARVGSESRVATTHEGKASVQHTREMLTLAPRNGSWQIVAIDWQPQPAPAGEGP